ncbi:MAG TPA: SIMPL domain-containing protein [Burkholderiaceae bacterium]|nr:SIMPL domain-containing protein [Burkholderiaceae bacterium]
MSPATTRILVVACALIAAGSSALADAPPPPQGVVHLTTSATTEVTKDLLTITLSTTKEGSDAAVVQAQLKQALDAALAEAKKSVRPGQLDVQTGNFQLQPRYTNKGVTSGWQGSAELIVEGRDMAAIGQLTGRITTLTIGGVAYNISRELREKTEGEVAAQAIARYRAKAADYAKQFGYTGYTLREVNVQSNDVPPVRPMARMSMNAMSASADAALPVEPGKGNVMVTVSGTVQMTK